jgi:hypothetical protein
MEKIIINLRSSSILLQQMNDILKNLPENDPANMIRVSVGVTTLLVIFLLLWLVWKVGIKMVGHYVLYYLVTPYRRRFARQEAIQRVMKSEKFEKLVQDELKLKNV